MFVLAMATACAPVMVDTPDQITLRKTDFSDLPGWNKDRPRGALLAFAKSCSKLLTRAPKARVGPKGLAGRVSDWQASCRAVSRLDPKKSLEQTRAFFEKHFRPYAVIGNKGANGLFTGYFEISLQGSLKPTQRYRFPLYRRPPDLVTADLGTFSETWRGRSIAGRASGGRLVPYADRKAILAGALTGKGLEIVWVDNAVDAFFLQIQGSGRVRLAGGRVMRLGYAGKNGHAYTSIGKVLIKAGALTIETTSMQSIRAWLRANPDRAASVLNRNRSFVFFRELQGDGPIGAQGVALTANRSLAVDRAFLPLGVPIWLMANDPGGALAPIQRLMVTQDTGGAIRGPVRGDVFMGWGDAARNRAGKMRMNGQYWILLPVSISKQTAGVQ